MYEIMIRDTFSAAHQLRNYGGKCEELHGHNWKVEVAVRAEELDETGLALDFTVLKAHTKKALEYLDHAFLNELAPFQEQNPSSENIARYIYKAVAKALGDGPAKVHRVHVWESENSRATYLGERS